MTNTLPAYAVDFRGHPACPCQAEWIPQYEKYLQFLGILGPNEALSIAQLIGFFSGSGSTHTGGGAGDYWLTGDRAERGVTAARDMGADATWHRLPGWDNGDGAEHVHSVLRGCPHLSLSAAAQIVAVDHNGDGLLGPDPDPGPRPLSGRTWREGIAWAQQQEDDVAYKDWPQADKDALKADLVPAIVAALLAAEVRKKTPTQNALNARAAWRQAAEK